MQISRRNFLKSTIGGTAALFIPVTLKGNKKDIQKEADEIKKIQSSQIKTKIFFVSKYHHDIGKFQAPVRSKRPSWYQIKHIGEPVHDEIVAYWLIENIPDENFPNKKLFSVRIYKNFGLKNDFVQPSGEEIQIFLNKMQTEFDSFGCKIYNNIRDYVLNNLLTQKECKNV